MEGNSWGFATLPWLLSGMCGGKSSISPSCAVPHALLIQSVPAVQGIQQLEQTRITPYISPSEKLHPLSHQPASQIRPAL